MISKKLKQGDEIRVISPARSMGIIGEKSKQIAYNKLQDIGFNVTFSKNIDERDAFNSSSIKSRVEDLHKAFKDPNVKAILTTIGGFNSNQLLSYLDYDLIKKNPKILCGFSDITALANAIYAKTGLVTYSGPHFSSFAMIRGLDYTINHFKKCLIEKESFEVLPSPEWSDDAWYKDQENRVFIKNEGYWTINEGKGSGKIIGGNMCTFNLLQGTEFMPSLKNSILFLEDDELVKESSTSDFDRNLQSLIHLPTFKGVKGIVIGRFQKESKVTLDLLTQVIKSKKELNNLPVIANVDFGHTTPIITFPIGGEVQISAKNGVAKITILKH